MQQPGEPAIEVGEEEIAVDNVVPAPARVCGNAPSRGQVPPPPTGVDMTLDPGLVQLAGQGAAWLESQDLDAPAGRPMEAEGQLDALTLGSRAVQILGHEEDRSARWCHGGESTRVDLAPEPKATSSSSSDRFGAPADLSGSDVRIDLACRSSRTTIDQPRPDIRTTGEFDRLYVGLSREQAVERVREIRTAALRL